RAPHAGRRESRRPRDAAPRRRRGPRLPRLEAQRPRRRGRARRARRHVRRVGGRTRVIVRIGTSGFAYDEWKGSFYPEKIAAKDMLKYYAERLPTVEINNT